MSTPLTTPAERREAALMWLADIVHDGYSPWEPLLAILPHCFPQTYHVHWVRLLTLVAEANDIRTGMVDDSHPILSRLSRGERPEKADELADALMVEARAEAAKCVAVHDARAVAA